jgi:hypothetical protein
LRCETSRLPHFLDNRLTVGGEVVSLARRSHFTPWKIPGSHFCYRLSRPQGHSAAGSITSTEKSNHIGNRTRNLPACRIARYFSSTADYTFKRDWHKHSRGISCVRRLCGTRRNIIQQSLANLAIGVSFKVAVRHT